MEVMVFIDGTWLWHSTMSLDDKLDLYKLPRKIVSVLSKKWDRELVLKDVILTSSIPVNVQPCDMFGINKRENFFKVLEEKCGYKVEIYNINFRGRSLNRSLRHPNDTWEPKEKCVDIAVASNLIYYAALNEYDVAVLITGDKDFLPALSKVTALNKKAVIASFRKSCSHRLIDNYPGLIFIDDLIDDIRMV